MKQNSTERSAGERMISPSTIHEVRCLFPSYPTAFQTDVTLISAQYTWKKEQTKGCTYMILNTEKKHDEA